jgi:hypothetical protein
MTTTSEAEPVSSPPAWQGDGNRLEKTFKFDDFRCDRVTVAFALRGDSTLTQDDVAVTLRIERLVGDHRHPVGRAGPWSPRGTLAGIRPRPVGQAGP